MKQKRFSLGHGSYDAVGPRCVKANPILYRLYFSVIYKKFKQITLFIHSFPCPLFIREDSRGQHL